MLAGGHQLIFIIFVVDAGCEEGQFATNPNRLSLQPNSLSFFYARQVGHAELDADRVW